MSTTPDVRPAPTAKLALDPDEFIRFLDDCEDWTDDQKREFIEELWKIIIQFVDLGFQLHPVQQAVNSREQMLAVISASIVSSGQDPDIQIDEHQDELLGGKADS
jgi:hypothetical protein